MKGRGASFAVLLSDFRVSGKGKYARILNYNRADGRKSVCVILICKDADSLAKMLRGVRRDALLAVGRIREPLSRIIEKYKPYAAIFDAEVERRMVSTFTEVLNKACVKIYHAAKTSRDAAGGGIAVVSANPTPLDCALNSAVKRGVDILGSLLLIIITLPLMAIIAFGVRLSSEGPVFFKQERVGAYGKKFKMLKFRSMQVNAESDTAWTRPNDPRKTSFGAFIRQTSLDELPQLFNVLFGEMSLVGPRPEIPLYVEKFKDRYPLYMLRHHVKPGITGLAQIKGLRGDTPIEDRICEDLYCVENQSFFLDILILLKTPFKLYNKSERHTSNTERRKRWHG